MGTPTEETWPDISKLPEYKPHLYKQYSQKELGFVCSE